MEEAQQKLLLSVVFALIIIVVLLALNANISKRVLNTNLLGEKTERIDIIVSDRVPASCFIPPDGSDSLYKALSDDEELRKICLRYESSLLGEKTVDSQSITTALSGGTKLDGYCYDAERDTCLGLEEYLDEGGKENTAERRSIEFGYESKMGLGSGFEKKELSSTGLSPSVFVVKRGEKPLLSIYAGIKVTGNKSVEKITAALYKGTVSNEESLLTEIVGVEKSCYFGKNFGCFSQEKGEAKCFCSETERYRSEPALETCRNFARLNNKNDKNFVDGCEEGEKRKCYLECNINAGAEECGARCACPECEEIFRIPESMDNYCKNLKGMEKGCKKFFEFEKNIFQIKAGNYTIVKIGDIGIEDSEPGKAYRGLAFASASMEVVEPHPGLNCYSPKTFNRYSECCAELCGDKGGKDCGAKGCSLEEKKIINLNLPFTGPETNCAENTNCSLVNNFETDDRFVLCKNFCESNDAYYGMAEETRECTEGCDEAERLYTLWRDVEIKDIEAVFVMDTSGSLNDEKDKLCEAVRTLTDDIENEGYNLKATLYRLTGGDKCSKITEGCPGGKIENKEITDINCESWGTGAEWAINNHNWPETPSRNIIFVIGDEGPYEGGGKEAEVNTLQDENAVTAAKNLAIQKGIVIYGLWGNMNEEIYDTNGKEAIKNMFREISEPTKGFAQGFNEPADIKKILISEAGHGEAYKKGYEKYLELYRNKVSSKTPLVFTRAYKEVYSALIYIVDWDLEGTSDWGYPYSGTEGPDWSAVKIQKTNDDGTYTPLKIPVKGNRIIYQDSFTEKEVSGFIERCYSDNFGVSDSSESETMCYLMASGNGFGSLTEDSIKSALPGEMRERIIFNLGQGKGTAKISYVGTNWKVRIS